MMTEIVCQNLIGFFLIYMGYRVRWKSDLSAVHKRHYMNVPEESRSGFCKGCGTGEIIAGIGCVVMPYVNVISNSTLGYWVGLVAIAVGFLIIAITIFKYNRCMF